VGDASAAVATLSLCGEPDVAYAVALCLGLDPNPHLIAMADAVADLASVGAGAGAGAAPAAGPVISAGLGKALFILDALGSPAPAAAARDGEAEGLAADLHKHEEKALLLSRYLPRALTVAEAAKWEVKDAAFWGARAREEEEIGSDAAAAAALVMAHHYPRAVELGVAALRRHVKDPADAAAGPVRALLHSLKHVRAEDADMPVPAREELLSYLFWFAAHEAAAHGLWETGWAMLQVLHPYQSRPLLPPSFMALLSCAPLLSPLSLPALSLTQVLRRHVSPAFPHSSAEVRRALLNTHAPQNNCPTPPPLPPPPL